MGKWPWRCTTTGLDNSTELRMEKIHQAVTEIWVPQVWQPPARPPGPWLILCHIDVPCIRSCVPIQNDIGYKMMTSSNGNIFRITGHKWKHFPCYWPFVRGIHRSPVDSPLYQNYMGFVYYKDGILTHMVNGDSSLLWNILRIYKCENTDNIIQRGRVFLTTTDGIFL